MQLQPRRSSIKQHYVGIGLYYCSRCGPIRFFLQLYSTRIRLVSSSEVPWSNSGESVVPI
jgi:hypothetical protein